MKRLFTILIVFLLSTICMASDKPAPAYEIYYDAKASAKECYASGDLDCMVENYLKAEQAALDWDVAQPKPTDTNWVEIADWQRNNAGYYLIQSQAKDSKRNKFVLEEALYLMDGIKEYADYKISPSIIQKHQNLSTRVISTPIVVEKLKSNIIYCKTQLGIKD